MVLSLWSSLHYLSFVSQDTMAYCRKTIEIFTEASTGWEIIIRDDEDVSPDLAILLPRADIRMEVSCDLSCGNVRVSRDVISHTRCSITSSTCPRIKCKSFWRKNESSLDIADKADIKSGMKSQHCIVFAATRGTQQIILISISISFLEMSSFKMKVNDLKTKKPNEETLEWKIPLFSSFKSVP